MQITHTLSILKTCALIALTSVAVTPAAIAQKITIPVGFAPAIDSPLGQGHVEWQRLLQERSGGQMTLELFPSDQLGSGKQGGDQMLMGEPVCHVSDPAFAAELGVPDMGIAHSPYIFKDWDDADRLFRTEWWLGLEDQLAQKGVKIIANNWRYGTRQTLTTRKVEHPQDFRGMKIRVPQSTLYVKTFEHLGASPTPMALTEVYTSLQQGVIDGLENPLSVIWGGRYHEAAKYLLIDNHMRAMILLACSSTLWNSLSPEQQTLLTQTAQEAGNYQNQLVERTDAALLDRFRAQGVTITETNYEEFSQAAASFFADPAFSGWSPGLHAKVLTLLGR